MGLPKRILVVDDEEQVAQILRESLRKLGDGYEVLTARNGHEALDRFREATFDLVITDLKMPGLDGVALTEAIHELSPSAMVIWVTAYGDEWVEAEAKRLGVRRYLDKPVDVIDVRHIARGMLEGAQPEAAETAGLSLAASTQEHLNQLQEEVSALSVLLITAKGRVVDRVGETNGLDIESLAGLVAANFQAAYKVARLLGRESTFKLSYQEGDEHKIYTCRVGTGHLLVIILGHEARPGAVWLFARRAIDRLEGVLSQALPEVSEQDIAPIGLLEGQRCQPDTLPGAKGLPEGGAAMPGLVSFEEAVALGLVRFDVGRREGTFGAG